MIPCVGFLTYLNPSRGARLINQIDCEVEKLVIINNSSFAHGAWEMCCEDNPLIKNVIVHTQYNTGCAVGWNMIVQSVPGASHWIILNDDLELAPGELARFDEDISSTSSKVVLCEPKEISLAMMGLKRQAIDQVGWFDENFYPCYFEDCDYARRIESANLSRAMFEGYKSSHSSGSLAEDPKIRETFEHNKQYYIKKWGGELDKERYKTPWNRFGPMSWALNLSRRQQLLDIMKG